MLYLILFGAPGSGKGTQSDLLVDKYKLTHLSTGDLLRKEIASGSELGKTINEYISNGNLIPDEMMISMLSSHIDNTPATAGFILDGFPRTVAQAEALQNMLEQREGAQTILVDLEVDKDELINRLLKRGETSGRSDDNLETIQKRLEVYHSQTQPLHDFYVEEGNYLAIKGTGSIEEIFDNIKAAIKAKCGK